MWLILTAPFLIEGFVSSGIVVFMFMVIFYCRIPNTIFDKEQHCEVTIGHNFVSCTTNSYVLRMSRDGFLRVRSGIFGTSIVMDTSGNAIIIPEKVIARNTLREMLEISRFMNMQKLIEYSGGIIIFAFLGSCFSYIPDISEPGLLAFLEIAAFFLW